MSVLTTSFAATRGDELALADDNGTRTWAELDERVNRLIHSFRAAGINAGDTIAIISGNCNEWFEIAFACANAGITFVPVNWHLVAAEILHLRRLRLEGGHLRPSLPRRDDEGVGRRAVPRRRTRTGDRR